MKDNFNYDENLNMDDNLNMNINSHVNDSLNMDDNLDNNLGSNDDFVMDEIVITPLYDDDIESGIQEEKINDDNVMDIDSNDKYIIDGEIANHDVVYEDKISMESNSDSSPRREIKKTSVGKATTDNILVENGAESGKEILNEDSLNEETFSVEDLGLDEVSGYQFRDVVSEQIVTSDNKAVEELSDKNMIDNEDVDFEFDDIAPYISKNDGNVTDINDKKSKKSNSKKAKDKKNKVKKVSKFKKLPKWAQVACIMVICLAFIVGGTTVAYNTVLAGLVNFKDFSNAEEQEEQFDTEDTLSDNEDIEVVEAEEFNWDIINGNSKYDPNIYNILIIGGDNASSTGYRGNSDTLIIVSIDKNTKKIKLSSIMRDTYVPIPNHSANKINSAFATGGVPLAKQTIEDNFKITIDSTVVINYTTFRKVIDKLGGVDDVVINEKEARFINSECRKKGARSDLSAGTVHLNALQTLNFARIRKITSDVYGHDDFGRTARQRFIMNQLFKKYKDLSYTELAQLASVVLGELEVDQALKKDMFLLLQVVLKFETDTLEEFRLPIDDAFSFAGVPIPGSGRTMSVVKIDDYWKENVDALHMFIYGDVDY